SAQMLKSFVGLNQRKFLDRGADWNARRQRKKFLTVATSQIGYRANAALLPKKFVRERRDVAHVNAPADYNSTLAYSSESHRHQFSCRRKNNRSIEWFRRQGG